ncbi:MAG: hypothetical protein JNL58_16195 [Planctomyces sp.]|nr:hypothetical protein [Planctomyces sp.]
MPIIAECSGCGKQYRFGEERAGQKLPCKECGGTIRVPSPRGGRSSGARESAYAPAPRNAGYGQPARRPSAGGGSGKLIVMIVIVSAVALIGVGGGIFAITWMMKSRGVPANGNLAAQGTPATGAGGQAANSNVDNSGLSEAEKAQRDAEYRERLAQQRVQSALAERDNLAREYGQDKVVTIVFDDVLGDSDAANKYLQRKVFRAAYADYKAGQDRANQQTDQNREAAKQQAISQHQQTWGGFGPTFVHYQYQQVESDVPYPQTINGGKTGNSYIYYAGPALNPQEFAQRLGVGTVTSVSGREIRIRAQLPVPIPDPDVEELAIAYGLEKVVRVRVNGAAGDEERVRLYLENETTRLGDNNAKIQMVALKTLGGGSYEFFAAPVNDIQIFGERIQWGTIASADRAAMLLTIDAKLPETLPSKEELDAIRKKKEEEERAIWQADVEQRARPGEAQLDWIVRVLTEKNSFANEKALRALSLLDVEPDRLEEVSNLLIQTLPEQKWHIDLHLASMMQWKTDKTEAAVLSLGGQHRGQKENEALMNALVKLGTEKSATALASALPDFFTGDMCVAYLIEMGPIAEEPVAAFLKNQDAKVRSRVYSVLAEIGTTKTAAKVRSNERIEENAAMKQQAADCVAAIKARIDANPAPEVPSK